MRDSDVDIRDASRTAAADLYVAQVRSDAGGGPERRSAQFFNGSASCLASRWRRTAAPRARAGPHLLPRSTAATLIPQSATARPHTAATLYFN